jgi:hypothetical protein
MRLHLGLQKERRLPRRGGKPSIGTAIVCSDLRMVVQAGFSDDLWNWLLSQNWRELTYRPDRRRYRELSSPSVMRLIDAPPELRAAELEAAAGQATLRRASSKADLPSYVLRR